MATKWQEIANAIQISIETGKLQAGDRLPTEMELVEQFGAARMTIHRAMTELQKQGIVSRKRRLGTVVELARPERRKVVGLVFFHTNDFPQLNYIHGIRDGLPDSIDLLLCDTHNNAEREADILRRLNREADAVVCYPTCEAVNTPLLQDIQNSGTPLVCVDRLPTGLVADAFVTDNYGSTRLAMRELLDGGHCQIAFFGYNELDHTSILERYGAYLDSMATTGIQDLARLTRLLPKGLGYDFDQLVTTVDDALFAMRHHPDGCSAVFCKDDYIMAAVLESCERQNLIVPADLAILSFNDCPNIDSRLMRRINRLVQQPHEMGYLAAQRLQARLTGQCLLPETTRVSATFHQAGPGNSRITQLVNTLSLRK